MRFSRRQGLLSSSSTSPVEEVGPWRKNRWGGGEAPPEFLSASLYWGPFFPISLYEGTFPSISLSVETPVGWLVIVLVIVLVVALLVALVVVLVLVMVVASVATPSAAAVLGLIAGTLNESSEDMVFANNVKVGGWHC